MAINYTLSIGPVTKKLSEGEFSNVVIEALFGVSAQSDPVTEVIGTDPETGEEILNTIAPAFSYSCGGRKEFDTSALDAGSFIDFDSITKDTITQWLLDSEGVNSVEEFSYVKSSIDNIARRIYDYRQQIPAAVPGDNPSGASTATYVPPTEPTEPTEPVIE